MAAKKLSSEEIIQQIQAGGTAGEKCIEQVYKQYFGYVYKALKKHRAFTLESAKDAYTDAIISFREQIVKGNFRGQASCGTYLYQIFSNKCIDIIRRHSTNKPEFEYELPVHISDKGKDILKSLLVREQVDQLLAYINTLGETCRKILIDWAFWGYKMPEIAERAGLKDARVATSKKYTCMQQLTKLIKKSTSETSKP